MELDEDFIDKYIVELKQRFQHQPFIYSEDTVERFLILTYDESEDSIPEILWLLIAALYVKGAIYMKSYVSRTIIFQIEAREKGSKEAILNWSRHLLSATTPFLRFNICMLKQYSNEGPVFQFNPNEKVEKEFDEIFEKIKAKFETL